ncbi:hypothetical protein L596_012998 [Steinernema carpocapsae]|uniref:Uncharacterized protein n=1 Tax=Steinernema carpocapsae TaxID=34508 RepID=A0A4U5NZR4_STECR|nr:hypothetical protein L596_012998 [Steinernema carpocapsae]
MCDYSVIDRVLEQATDKTSESHFCFSEQSFSSSSASHDAPQTPTESKLQPLFLCHLHHLHRHPSAPPYLHSPRTYYYRLCDLVCAQLLSASERVTALAIGPPPVDLQVFCWI